MGKVLYDIIYKNLRHEVRTGAIPTGSFLPSELELTQRYGCSRMTVRKAISLLANEGLVQSIRGRGVRVIWSARGSVKKEDTFSVEGLPSFTESARAIDAVPSASVFLLDHVECTPDIADTTGFPEGADLTRVNLVRSLDGERMAIDRHHFLTSEVPGIDQEVATSSLFHYIESSLGIAIMVSEREITVEEPNEKDRELLGLDGPIYLAVTRSRTYDSNGVEFEYVESKYLPRYFHFFDTATRNPLP